MTDEIDNIVLEHLRHIRAKVDTIESDMTDLKIRMTSLERGMSAVKYEIAYCAETDTRQQGALDKINGRLDRIEKRLELRND
jgi:outer membrane murein-binding lipoprotein Lpp